jgi:hypothetical protein
LHSTIIEPAAPQQRFYFLKAEHGCQSLPGNYPSTLRTKSLPAEAMGRFSAGSKDWRSVTKQIQAEQ